MKPESNRRTTLLLQIACLAGWLSGCFLFVAWQGSALKYIALALSFAGIFGHSWFVLQQQPRSRNWMTKKSITFNVVGNLLLGFLLSIGLLFLFPSLKQETPLLELTFVWALCLGNIAAGLYIEYSKRKI